MVFGNPEKLEKLNSIAHPLIVGKIKEAQGDNVAVELPLAIESGILDTFDKVIMVDTKKRIRLKRLEGRGLTRKRAMEIMSVQVPIRKLKERANIIITNNGTMDELTAKADAIAISMRS